MSNKIIDAEIITNNCTLVKGLDNKLRLLLPVIPEIVEKVNATSVPAHEAVADAPSEAPAEEPAEEPFGPRCRRSVGQHP